MTVEVKVPGVGESVQEGMIEAWHKENGEFVNQDEVLLEIETDKATVEVVADVSGALKILAPKGKVVKVGEVIATLDETAKATVASSQVKNEEIKTPVSSKTPEVNKIPKPVADEKSSRAFNLEDHGPAVSHKARNEGLDLTGLSGSGRGGRVTKEDLIKMPPAPKVEVPNKAATPAPKFSFTGERTERREPMSMLRRRVSERLLSAQQNAAILTTFNEVDLSEVIRIRKKYKDSFEKTHGVKLGFMSFFLKASCYALEKFPKVNAYIDGNEILYHDYCDIGVAVSTPKGLLVPVLRNVEKMGLADIELSIADYAQKARNNKISLDELSGGTFTVSNGGVFGSLLSTPILNPPQSAILGMHKTQERPVVTESKTIEARPMMYLALSYDHRIIDGKESVGFLLTIKNCLEDPARFLLGV